MRPSRSSTGVSASTARSGSITAALRAGRRSPVARDLPAGQRRSWAIVVAAPPQQRSEEHTSELQSPDHLVCRLLLEKKKNYAPPFDSGRLLGILAPHGGLPWRTPAPLSRHTGSATSSPLCLCCCASALSCGGVVRHH